MIFDTHCHYNLKPLAEKWVEHWQTAQAHGIRTSVIVGTSLETTKLGCQIAASHPNLYASLGIHPHVFHDAVVENHPVTIDQVQKSVLDLRTSYSDKIVAVGETGLDYFWLPKDEAQQKLIKQLQETAFVAQIDLANELKLPLILHVRDTTDEAYHRVLELLQSHYHHLRPFILHCISGPLAYVKRAIELGGYIGVAGNVAYAKAQGIRDLVLAVPKDKILLETDAPYLPPQQHRGQTCEPWMITQTEQFLVTQLNIDSEQLYENAATLFNVP